MPDSPQGGRQSGRIAGEGQAKRAPVRSDARSAGRGFVLISGAKLWFLVMGAVVSIGLPIFMTPDDFGVYSIVTNVMSLLNMVIITGTTQAVSKLVSEQPALGWRRIRQASLLQCVVGVPIGVAYILCAGLIAELFNDPSLAPLIRISGGVLLAYGFYAIFVGYLNGVEAFGRQALLDVLFATMKTSAILTMVLVGFGVAGALWGFVGAAAVIVVVAPFIARSARARVESGKTEEDDDGGGMGKLAVYLVLVMLFTFAVNGVLRADLFLLKAMTEPLEHLAADRLAGVYTAMLNLSRLPYQAVIAVTFVVFPMISRSTFEKDLEKTRVYIRSTLRYSVLMLVLLGALLAASPGEVIALLYGDAYADGAAPLAFMALATVGFAVFFIATAMTTGAGRPGMSVLLAVVVLVLSVGLSFTFISMALAEGAGEADLLLTAAGATATAMVLGCAASVGYLLWAFRAGVPILTVVRVAAAAGTVLLLAHGLDIPIPDGRLAIAGMVIVRSLVVVLLFGGILFVTREFTAEDRERLMSVIGRGRRSS